MTPHYRLAGSLALASIVLGAAAFSLTMLHLAGSLPLWAFPASALCATGGWVALGAPRSRHERRLNRTPASPAKAK